MDNRRILITGIAINRPEWFADPAFVAWLNDPVQIKMTWHQGGEPTEWSDVMVFVDPSMHEGKLAGEGSNSDMPEHIWDAIVAECDAAGLGGQRSHIPVRITNYPEC